MRGLLVCCRNPGYKYRDETAGMRRVAMLGMLGAVQCLVRETPIEEVSLSEAHAHLYNGIKKDHFWDLKNGAAGAVVNFKHKNSSHDEWSFEMVVEEPSLSYPEFAGLYFWYTDQPIEHGPYKGARGQYQGIMAGIERLGTSLDIVVATNHGEHDFSHFIPEQTELKDSPDPSIFRNQSELTFKVISTAKNFKIEIYGANGALLYDKVRYKSITELADRLAGKFFGISTEYHEIKAGHSLRLKSVRFNAREESPEYRPEVSHSVLPEMTPRAMSEIETSSTEIQHTISVVEHMIKYLRIVLGEPQSRPMAESIIYLKKLMNFQSAHVLELRDKVAAMAEISKRHADFEDRQREEMLRLLKEMQAGFHKPALAAQLPHPHRQVSLLSALLFCALSFGGGYLVAKQMQVQRKLVIH